MINTYVSLMCELKKKLGRYLRVNLWDRALVLWKKNLPDRGLSEVEKHRHRVTGIRKAQRDDVTFSPIIIITMIPAAGYDI